MTFKNKRKCNQNNKIQTTFISLHVADIDVTENANAYLRTLLIYYLSFKNSCIMYQFPENLSTDVLEVIS